MQSNLWQHPAPDDKDEHQELLDDQNHCVIVHLGAVIHSSAIKLNNEHEELLNDKNHCVVAYLGAVFTVSLVQI
jgi:hypothetical protein